MNAVPASQVTNMDIEGTEETAHAEDLRRPNALASLRETIAKLTRESHLFDAFFPSTPTSNPTTTITPSPNPKPALSSRASYECDPRTHKSQLAEINKLVERCKWLEVTIKSKDKEITELKRERDTLVEERKKYQSAKNHRDESYERRSDDSSSSGSKFSQPRSASSSPLTYKEEYIAHVQSFDVFMTKTDNWSGSQVIQAVRDLNSEIMQFAAAATELCTFDEQSTTSIAQETQNTASRLGPNLANVLATRDHSQDPMLIQFALQSAICGCVHRSLTSFSIGFPSKYDALLGQLYLRLCKTEAQPISSRWRSFTHRTIRSLFPSIEVDAIEELVDMMLLWSKDILMLSGSPTAIVPLDTLRSRFGVQLQRIAQGTCRLARVTKEEILSMNFEIMAVEHGTLFDPQMMANEFEEYGASKGRVLCTSEIGLRCFRTGGEERVNMRTLLLPKVILESVIQVL